MEYVFRCAESLPRAVHRIVAEELESAQHELQDPARSPDVTTHDVRKHIKKTRAVLRLMRRSLGGAFTRENPTLREAAKILSPARDAAVLLDTFDHIRASAVPETENPALDRIRETLRMRKDRVLAEHPPETHFADVSSILAGVRERMDSYTVEKGFGAFVQGMKRVFAAGRRAMNTASRENSPDAFHEWRKQAKVLWYATCLLQHAGGRSMTALREDLDDLSDLLGKVHDLDVLADTLASDAAFNDSPTPDAFANGLTAVRREWCLNAIDLGTLIYAETPRAFHRRIRAYTKAWRRRS